LIPAEGVTRRGLLGGAASLGIGAGFGYATKGLLDVEAAAPIDRAPTSGAVEFHGTYQAGIATPALEFLSFNVVGVAAGGPKY
jgi:deferrochelatase/peroxidase EfeB